MSVYTYIVYIKIFTWIDNAPWNNHQLPGRIPTPGMRNTLLSCWVQLSKRFPKYRLLLLPLVAFQRQKVRPYCWRHFGNSARRIWASSEPKASLPRTSFHGTRRSHASFQGREATTALTQGCCVKQQHGAISLRMQWWHPQPCGKQQLSHWAKVLLNEREIPHGIGHLARASGVMDLGWDGTSTAFLKWCNS